MRKWGLSRRLAEVLVVFLSLAGCGDDDGLAGEPVDVAVVDGCGLTQQRHCLLPFPNNDYVRDDPSADSGRRMDLPEAHAPANNRGIRADLQEWNRSDGFSPGAPLYVDAPGVDLSGARIGTLSDLGTSLSEDSLVVLVDLATGERHPHWVEMDAWPEDDADRLMIIRPARNFEDGHTYAVGVRQLYDSEGIPLALDPVFAAYRDRVPTTSAAVERRRAAMEGVFAALSNAGVDRGELWLAWEFTVASTRSLSERVLAMRDGAFLELGEAAPTFEVSRVQEAGSGVSNRTARYVYGSFAVPNFLEGEGAPGSRILYGADGLPEINQSHPQFEAHFACIVPTAATLEDGEPARAAVYGHGLLGTRFEVVEAWDIVLMTSEHNLLYCGTDWIGMSFDDATTIGTGLIDISNFPKVADRLQQGFVNFQFLARLMTHPEGFASHEAFREAGRSVIDTSDVFYDGNSMGGILGGAATAISTEWTRAVLGVPGMNFSTLLDRSLAFAQFRPILEASYPDPIERQIVMALIQMIWDRGENNGYANHFGDDPLPGTPEHQILFHVALGDFQVADITAFVAARSFGAAFQDPLLVDERREFDHTFGLEPLDYPWSGSAIMLWDSGVPNPPTENLPPTGDGDPLGRHDPHQDPRYDADVRWQKSEFMRSDGVVIDVCEGPCFADRWG